DRRRALAPGREDETLGCVVEADPRLRRADPAGEADPAGGGGARRPPLELAAIGAVAPDHEIDVRMARGEGAEGGDRRADALHAVVEAPGEEQVPPPGVEPDLAAGRRALERPMELGVDDPEEELDALGRHAELRDEPAAERLARDEQAMRPRERPAPEP